MKKNFPLLALVSGIAMILLSFGNSKPDMGVEINQNKTFKNLKVLPKDISDDDLKAVMREFNAALGVKCSHCHAPGADGKLDFASDAKPVKNVARDMMRMTKGINKKYFGEKDPQNFTVNCMTCHSGNSDPNKNQTLEALPTIGVQDKK